MSNTHIIQTQPPTTSHWAKPLCMVVALSVAAQPALIDSSKADKAKWFIAHDANGDALRAYYRNATAGYHRYVFEKPVGVAAISVSSARVARLNGLQSIIGGPVQTLADLLRISRPQLYKWLDVDRTIELQRASRLRLQAMEQIATHWARLTPQTLWPWLRNGNEDLLAKLTADELDVAAATAQLTKLASTIELKTETLSSQMRDAGFKRRLPVTALPTDA